MTLKTSLIQEGKKNFSEPCWLIFLSLIFFFFFLLMYKELELERITAEDITEQRRTKNGTGGKPHCTGREKEAASDSRKSPGKTKSR